MKPLPVTAVYSKTKELFGDTFPMMAVSNLRGDFNKLSRILQEAGDKDGWDASDLKRVVFLGNAIGPKNTPPSLDRTIDCLMKNKAMVLRGPMEEALIRIDDAIKANSEEDLLFHMTIFLTSLSGPQFLQAFTAHSKGVTSDLELAETNRDMDAFIRLWSALPKSLIEWLRTLPTALLFVNSISRGDAFWNGSEVVIMSYGQHLGFEEDPSTLMVSPHRACQSIVGNNGIPMTWIPFVLFPDRVVKDCVRIVPQYVIDPSTRKYVMSDGPVPQINVLGHTICTPTEDEECMFAKFANFSSAPARSQAWTLA